MTRPDPTNHQAAHKAALLRMSRIDEIESRLNAAVKEPWYLAGGDEWISPIGISIAPDDGGVSIPEGEFIANAPSDIAYLIAELRKASS